MKRRAHGEGSVYKRKNNGLWVASANVTLANGDTKRAYVTAKTREEVVVKLRELIEQEKRQIPYEDKGWTVGEYLDYWMSEVQSKRVRETTMTGYSLTIKNHIKPVLGKLKLKTLSTIDARRAMDELEKRGCSGAMRLECRKILSACLNCAMRDELVHRNVAQLIEKPEHTPRETVIWTAEQSARFLRASKEHVAIKPLTFSRASFH